MDELKPCPFCGCKARVLTTSDFYYEVLCLNLECKINPATRFYKKEEEAIEAWNRRTDNG